MFCVKNAGAESTCFVFACKSTLLIKIAVNIKKFLLGKYSLILNFYALSIVNKKAALRSIFLKFLAI